MPRKGQPKNPRQPVESKTGRFQTVLTPELVDKLCETHRAKDFRNVTAARCQVHPKLLTRWLSLGRDNENAGTATDLYMRFLAIEGEIRAGWIAEVENTTASVETTEFENGKPVSRTVEARRTTGVQWLLEKRFPQFRVEHAQTADEQDALSMLQPQAQTMTLEMAEQVCRQLAAAPERLPPAIRALFASTDWQPPALKDSSHAETETSH